MCDGAGWFSPLFQELLALHPHDLAPAHGLDHRDDLSQTLISHVLQLSQKTSLKEHLERPKHGQGFKSFVFFYDDDDEFGSFNEVRQSKSAFYTLVWPNLYCVSSMSRELSSF